MEILAIPVVLCIAIVARFREKKIMVGLGPEPLINNVYHKKALELYGYSAQTFVGGVFFITERFDVRADKLLLKTKNQLIKMFLFVVVLPYYLFAISVFRYKCIYIYFNGGPLGLYTTFLWRVEPFLYDVASTKVVVMPYGGDVQDLTRSPNHLLKNSYSVDYPTHRLRKRRISSQIDLWTKYADHVISGCEWVDYMYHWDTLMIAHFSIDLEEWKPSTDKSNPIGKRPLRILHAPNHRAIKGTRYFLEAVSDLVSEGYDIELTILQRVSNEEIKKAIERSDVVADQLVVGWYAMFAIEAMALEKPVLCYLREDLMRLYCDAGLLDHDIPIITCSPSTVKETIRSLALNPGTLSEIGKRSRVYVSKHHSVKVIGGVFDKINRSLGLSPILTK